MTKLKIKERFKSTKKLLHIWKGFLFLAPSGQISNFLQVEDVESCLF